MNEVWKPILPPLARGWGSHWWLMGSCPGLALPDDHGQVQVCGKSWDRIELQAVEHACRMPWQQREAHRSTQWHRAAQAALRSTWQHRTACLHLALGAGGVRGRALLRGACRKLTDG